jgi:hypothetical protein
MHTDGVSARFELTALPAFRSGDPQALAAALLGEWGRDTDDATVVVVDGRGS